MDLASGRGGAGEGHRRDTLVGDEVRTGGETVHDVDHAVGHTCFDEGRRETFAHEGCHRRRLEDDGVARRECGTDLAARHVQREIPRCDDRNDADRIEDRVHERRVVARERRAGESVGLTRVQFEILRRSRGLVQRVGERFALFAHHFGGRFLCTGSENARCLGENVGALRRGRCPPLGERIGGRVDGCTDIVDRRLGCRRDDLAPACGVAALE